MWHTKLQIAIIEKDTKAISKLISQMPDFSDIDEMKRASVLIKESLNLLHTLKDETAVAMQQLKKHRDFLNSTHSDQIAKFDITS